MAYESFFTPKNTHKYVGNIKNIKSKSTWERQFMKFLDEQENIINWSYEPSFIIYESPIDGLLHRYYPDFWVKKVGPDGKIKCALIEIKPDKQTKPPAAPKNGKVTKKFLIETSVYMVNAAKFAAAKKYCEELNWEWIVMTEKELFNRETNG